MKKFLLVLIVLSIVLSCVFLGYYMLDSFGVLSDSIDSVDSDKWSIKISASKPEIKGSSVVNSTEIKKTDIKINGNLKGSEDIITYDLKIKNNGSIDAYLYTIINNDNNLVIKYLNGQEELKDGFILKSGKHIDVKMIIKCKDNNPYDFNLNAQLIFNQYSK